VPERGHEQQRLLREYRGTGDPEALVECFLPLARGLARRAARGAEPLDDLEQVASLALLKAVDGFDADRGTAFSSCALPSILGALKRHYRDCGWAVRPPRALQELALRVRRINDELTMTSGVPPTVAEIAEHAGVEVEAVLEALEAYRALHADSLDRPAGPDQDRDGEALIDTVGARDAEIARAFDRVTLEALLATLDDRERQIIELYYQHELTQAEIGQRLGYSQMHISRLLRRAVERLLLAAAAHDPDLSRRTAA
jgi:RNA polymerase sigma-B factor